MNSNGHQQTFYEIRIEGHLEPYWSEIFNGMELTLTQDGETILAGAVADQATLHGLLAKIRDLNMTLISVIQVGAEMPPHSRIGR